MARHTVPPLRRHKLKGRTDRAFVVLGGRRHYLGAWGSQEARDAYDRLVIEWLSNAWRPPSDPQATTVSSLLAAYWRHAQTYYAHRDGTPTSTQAVVKHAISPLRRFYGSKRVVDFEPRDLVAIREHWVREGHARKTVNDYLGHAKRAFRWGTAEGIVPGSVYEALRAVEGLRAGRSQARETEPVQPVPEESIEAVRQRVPSPVRALIDLQLATGARAGELVGLRPIDFDTSGPVWKATLRDHKTAHHGKTRTLHFGPRAQDVLGPFLKGRPVHRPLFSPAEAEAERRAAAREARKTHPGTNRSRDEARREQPRESLGDRYDVATYRRAIQRACDRAWPPPDDLHGDAREAWRRRHRWSPHRLRHTAATRLERQYGPAVAGAVLGHAQGSTITASYIEENEQRVAEVMREAG